MDLKKVGMWLLMMMLAVACIFNEGSPLVDSIGLETTFTISMLIGIAYFAVKEADGDYMLEKAQLPVTHADSAILRVVGVFMAMLLLGAHYHLYWSYFLWNMAMFLASYSYFFNIRLAYNRDRHFAEYISGRGKSKYDKMWYYIAFKNGHLAGWLKTLFDFSAIPTLFALNHFGINMPEQIIIRP